MVETPQTMSRQMMNRPYNGMYVDTPRNTQFRDDRLMVPQGLPLRQSIQAAERGLSPIPPGPDGDDAAAAEMK